jgi:thiol-disulfide isomerase/thioredoxin
MKKTLLSVILAAALIAGLATYFYKIADPAATEPEAAATLSQGPGVSAAGQPASQPLRQATTRPDFSLADTTGAVRSIKDWDGKALVVNFWATWCAPCRREMPLLTEMEAEYAPDDIQIVGVAVDFREDVLSYLAQSPVTYPVLIGEQDAIDAAEGFGVEFMAMPFTAFTDHKGNILHVKIGELHRPEIELIFKAIKDIRAGKIDPPMARRLIAHGLAGVREPGS